MTVSAVSNVSANAEESVELYPYTLFAASSTDGAITVNANNFCVNGNVATNGTIVSSGNMNVNGTITEHADKEMFDFFKELNATYFVGENVEAYTQDHVIDDLNVNINDPITVDGSMGFAGNINLNSDVKVLYDININNGTLNSNNAIICSELGDITIEATSVNFNGLIYAPYGDIVIKSDHLNLNNVVIIGQTITLTGNTINVGNNYKYAKFINDCLNEDAEDPTEPTEPVEPTENAEPTENVEPTDPSEKPSEDVPSSDKDAFIYAYGVYNDENKTIDIKWFTEDDENKFKVLSSENDESYEVIAEIEDETKYSYEINEDSDEIYFKVSFIGKNGNTVESDPFKVSKTENGYEVIYKDSDEDGLSDALERIIGTDINDPDTDKDDLTDYQEMYITQTDPTVFDSFEKMFPMLKQTVMMTVLQISKRSNLELIPCVQIQTEMISATMMK